MSEIIICEQCGDRADYKLVFDLGINYLCYGCAQEQEYICEQHAMATGEWCGGKIEKLIDDGDL